MSRAAEILVMPHNGQAPDGRSPVQLAVRRERGRWLLVVLAALGLALFALGALMSAREETAGIRRLASRPGTAFTCGH